MGRIAGVTAEETRGRLLAAAATAFERQGYEGARVADIADAAGVSKGALYAHFPSKAALLAAALADHGRRDLVELFAGDEHRCLVDLLRALGDQLLDRPVTAGALVTEALVAARRDPEVATTIGAHLAERQRWLCRWIEAARADGEVAPAVAPDALARFCTMVALGSALLPAAGLPPVDHADWSVLVARIVGAVQVSSGTEAAAGTRSGTEATADAEPGGVAPAGRASRATPGQGTAERAGAGRTPQDVP